MVLVMCPLARLCLESFSCWFLITGFWVNWEWSVWVTRTQGLEPGGTQGLELRGRSPLVFRERG